ncbi:MAG TPA: 6-phosphogluconolactonase, partial [Gemmatimonadaceae bacterium]|nr:6-phosphogluconolactonase [Gemmatimonadaceae bacterium]
MPTVAEPEIVIAEDLDGVSRLAASAFVQAARAAIRARGRFTVALAGGQTPQRLYTILADAYGEALDWARVHVYFGDERSVLPEDALSNYYLVRVALLDHVPVPPSQVHRIHGELPPADAAAEYERQLRDAFAGGAEVPAEGHATFDLAVLGAGADGHTASLFAASAALAERERWAVPVEPWPTANPRVPRVTLTLPVLCGAETVHVLATGPEKQMVVEAVRSGARGAEAPPPAVLVRGRATTT